MRAVRADMKTSRLVVESSARCTSLTRQSSFTPLTALRFHSKHTQTLRFRLRRQSAPRLRGKNWTYVAASCRRASKKKKLPKLQIYTSLPAVSLQGLSVNTSGSNRHVRSFSSFFFALGGMSIVFLNVKLLSLSPPPFFFSSYVSEIPNFPPKWRPRVGRMSRDSRPYPWPPNHGTELPFSSGLGRWDFTLS